VALWLHGGRAGEHGQRDRGEGGELRGVLGRRCRGETHRRNGHDEDSMATA
jgi:hypothetical protein